MPYTNVSSSWVSGDLYFYDKNGNEIFHIDGTNRALAMHASASLSGTGLTALLAAGLGTSVTYVKTDSGTKTLLAANATKGRGVLVLVTINETYANVGGAQPTVKIGETGTTEKGIAAATLTGATAGSIFVAGFTNTATDAIIATLTAATVTATGGCTITVIALPNS